MDLFNTLQNLGPMVEQMAPSVESAAGDLTRIADALEGIRGLLSDWMNYSVARAAGGLPTPEMLAAIAAMQVNGEYGKSAYPVEMRHGAVGAGAEVEADRG